MFCRYKDTEIREGSTVGNVVRKTTLSLAVALACVGSNWANALSLGEIRVLSHLAEPFRAEISLPIANREELEELRIQLAPEQVFEQAGLDNWRRGQAAGIPAPFGQRHEAGRLPRADHRRAQSPDRSRSSGPPRWRVA